MARYIKERPKLFVSVFLSYYIKLALSITIYQLVHFVLISAEKVSLEDRVCFHLPYINVSVFPSTPPIFLQCQSEKTTITLLSIILIESLFIMG